METNLTYDSAGGSLTLWLDEAGAIMLKVRELGDPVELAGPDALGLAGLLMRLALEPDVAGT